jgi:hypothetical protein
MQKHDLIPAKEFCMHYHVEMSFLNSLQEYELLETFTEKEESYIPAEKLNELEKIIRLHYELNVNLEGIDVILHLLKSLEDEQAETIRLRNALKFYSGDL